MSNETKSQLKQKKCNNSDDSVHTGFAGRLNFHMSEQRLLAVLLVIYDIAVLNGAYLIALWLRFDCHYSEIPLDYFEAWLKYVPINSVVILATFVLLKLYSSLWRFAGYDELKHIITAVAITSVSHITLITLIFKRMPISYYAVGSGLGFVFVFGIRFLYRFILLEKSNRKKIMQSLSAKRVMLIGAGSAGQMILKEIKSIEEVKEVICCIIDDDHTKHGKYISSVPIIGGREDILLGVEKYKIDKIYFAIPSADATIRRDILDICKETSCEIKVLPAIYHLVNDAVTTSSMKDVTIEDLLGREPIDVNIQNETFEFLSGKVVMVTGGGGSIGSELCRQIAKHSPKQLIIFDIYENNAYDIRLELKDKFPELNLEVLIGSVRDSRRLNQVFSKYKPDVVYHAAAHKHVPLMEDSPCEAIKNNALGTYKTAYAAMQSGCKRFVLISTDKAVNPTNIMGASKRICEMIIQTFDKKVREGKAAEISPIFTHIESDALSDGDIKVPIAKPVTEFVAVRFGNVLGSNGSVVPVFKKQIAAGGPVTVTHPDIIRYFMTIPEAVSLILQAGANAKGGEIFVLDMGNPVKIDDLARNLIKLSGLRPDVDIKISYTGLRPGEKMFEEKLMGEEGLKTTANKLIHIGKPIVFDENDFLCKLQTLLATACDGDENEIREQVAQIVTTYNYRE